MNGAPAVGGGAKEVHTRPLIVWLLYAAFLTGEVIWIGIVPLIPSYSERFSLSKLQSGLLLSVASISILLASIPVGSLTQAFGARRITLGAVALIAAADIGAGASNSYWSLLLSRALFGLGFGALWISGAEWLSQVAGRRRSQALAFTTTVIGIASLVGPTFAGLLAQHFGLHAPFLIASGATGLVLILLTLSPRSSGVIVDTHPSLVEMLRNSSSHKYVLASMLLAFLGGLVMTTASLLVPLRLAKNGFSTADIGLAFSASSVLFVVASPFVARRAERYARPRIAAILCLLVASSTAIVVFSTSTVATVLFLVSSGAITSGMFALTYPLGIVAAKSGAVSVAVIGALLSTVYALSGLFGPTMGGALAQASNDQVAFGVVAITASIGAVWAWTPESAQWEDD